VQFLERFTNGRIAIPIEMFDFGHFNVGVAFWDVLQHSEALTLLQKELCDSIEEQLPWVTFQNIEPNGHPHVTIAENGIKGRFPAIYKYVKGKYGGASMGISLSTINLYGKEQYSPGWNTLKSFILKPSP
jgi:2'-5' RNA ligase